MLLRSLKSMVLAFLSVAAAQREFRPIKDIVRENNLNVQWLIDRGWEYQVDRNQFLDLIPPVGVDGSNRMSQIMAISDDGFTRWFTSTGRGMYTEGLEFTPIANILSDETIVGATCYPCLSPYEELSRRIAERSRSETSTSASDNQHPTAVPIQSADPIEDYGPLQLAMEPRITALVLLMQMNIPARSY